MSRYDHPRAGQWIRPIRRGYRLACCDCGLVHRLDFQLVRIGNTNRRIIRFRAFRDRRATAALRREDRKRADRYLRARE